MFYRKNKITTIDINLYNNLLLLSRNKVLYTKFGLKDTFQNRINLIFIHSSFLINKIKSFNEKEEFKLFNQKIFDLIFKKIEENMREEGQSDTSVNKNMKYLVKVFYNILLNCETYIKKNASQKGAFLIDYLSFVDNQNKVDNTMLINYFDRYCFFCLDLSSDKVLKGELNFTYK